LSRAGPPVKVERVSAERARRRRGSRARVVAITGVHGVPGARLLRRLDEDDQVSRVVLLDRHAPALPLRKAVSVIVDLTATFADAAIAEILARERVETVVHAAFHAAPVHALEAAHELEVIGTRTLLHAVAHDVRHGGTVESLVVLGTTMSYGAMPDNSQYASEDAPLRGGANYPFVADKVAVEREVAAFRRRTGLPTTMLRVGWTMGELETIAGRMFAPMLVPAVLGADPLVQLIHVDDVVDAARLAAHAGRDGTFNIAGDGVLPFSTVIKLVGRLRAAAPESAVRAALDALWVAGIGNVPGAHTAYLRDTFVADTSRAPDLLGFQPRYAIRDAIAHHVAARRGGAGRAA
jgi:UDP-glucose 4-epimerase